MFNQIWKYLTKEHCQEFLLSLCLLDGTDLTPEQQLVCLYSVSNHIEAHYQVHQIPKRDGTKRTIHEPDPLLKLIQRNLLHHVLDHITCSTCATAYRKGQPIVANATPHVDQQLLLKLDIEDFFGSITFPMIYQKAFPVIYFPPQVATLLTHLCCYEDALPQGAPTSAAISNIVMRPFDDHMVEWCQEREIVYTRYSDDLTFSGDFEPRDVISKVRNFLAELGFELNRKKTRVLYPHQQQAVTGIVVNQKPQIAKSYRKELRQEIYYCLKFGAAAHLAFRNNLETPPDKTNQLKYLQHLLGKVNYVLQVNPEDPAFQTARTQLLSLIAAIQTEN